MSANFHWDCRDFSNAHWWVTFIYHTIFIVFFIFSFSFAFCNFDCVSDERDFYLIYNDCCSSAYKMCTYCVHCTLFMAYTLGAWRKFRSAFDIFFFMPLHVVYQLCHVNETNSNNKLIEINFDRTDVENIIRIYTMGLSFFFFIAPTLFCRESVNYKLLQHTDFGWK